MTIDPENRKKFEAIGLEQMTADAPVGAFFDSGPARGQAVEWVAEQHALKKRDENFRFWATIILTGIAAVASCIAAWPVIRGL